jgi:hypothetical protein
MWLRLDHSFCIFVFFAPVFAGDVTLFINLEIPLGLGDGFLLLSSVAFLCNQPDPDEDGNEDRSPLLMLVKFRWKDR